MEVTAVGVIGVSRLTRRWGQRRQNPVIPKQHWHKKSVSSAFFQLMRPISSAFTSDTLSVGGGLARRHARTSTLCRRTSRCLSRARVAQFVNNERSFVF